MATGIGKHALNFGRQLRHFRERAGMSQATLAQTLGVGKTWISNVEHGERAPMTIRRILAAGDALMCSEQEVEDLARLAAAVPRLDVNGTLAAAVDRYGPDAARAKLEAAIARRHGRGKHREAPSLPAGTENAATGQETPGITP